MMALSPGMRASTARTSSRVKTTGSPLGLLGPQDILDTFQGPIEHDFVEEENRAERLILRRSRNVSLDRR